MNKLKVLDLFAGVGGFSLGLHRAGGFSTAAFVEIDKHCQDILKKNFPKIPIANDIKNLYFTDDGIMEHDGAKGRYFWQVTEETKIDVITAGWPCQGISVAGKKKGLKDERSGLWTEVKRVIKEIKPGWVILENSPNLRNLGLARVLQDLWEIGYHNIRWDILSAESYGAIHKRERIYIVANCNGHGLSEATYAPTEEASRRRAEARSDISRGRCPEPRFYRVDDGNAPELDPALGSRSRGVVPGGRGDGLEKVRKQRVKQCGNSVYIPIVEFIGRYILQIENSK